MELVREQNLKDRQGIPTVVVSSEQVCSKSPYSIRKNFRTIKLFWRKRKQSKIMYIMITTSRNLSSLIWTSIYDWFCKKERLLLTNTLENRIYKAPAFHIINTFHQKSHLYLRHNKLLAVKHQKSWKKRSKDIFQQHKG